MNVTELIRSLKADGTLDSEGRFTVSLNQARHKLKSFTASDSSRYLLLLIGAGVAAGATSLVLTSSSEKLQLMMPGAYFDEGQLMAGFEQLFLRKGRPFSTDLLLGLQLAQSHGATRCEVVCQDPERPSFGWELDKAEGTSEEAPDGPTSTSITLHFAERSWSERFLGDNELQDELAWVRRFCKLSRLPLELDSISLNQPILVDPSPTLLVHGEGLRVESQARAQVEDPLEFAWSAALGLGPGPLSLVRYGVSFPGPEDLFLRGAVYHDDLPLDLSREKLVEGKAYKALMSELLVAREKLLVATDLELVPPSLIPGLAPLLIEPAVSGKLSLERMKILVEWLDRHPVTHSSSDRRSEAKFLYQMAQLFEKVGDPRLKSTAVKAYDQAQLLFAEGRLNAELVEMCGWLATHLNLTRAAQHWKLLRLSMSLARRRADSEVLLREQLRLTRLPVRLAYLHLGLAAFLETRGDEETAAKEKAVVAHLMERIDNRTELRMLKDLLREDADLVCSVVAHTLRHHASHSKSVALAQRQARRR